MHHKTSNQVVPAILSPQDVSDLENVFGALQEQRSSLMHLSGLMGEAVGGVIHLGSRGLSMVPSLQEKLDKMTRMALAKAFNLSISGLSPKKRKILPEFRLPPSFTQASVAVSGVLGGFSGFLGLVPDISYTTLTIMREIARIAREEGEDLSDPETRAVCLEIFAFKAFAEREDQEIELGFFSARTLLRGQSMMMLMGNVASHYGFALGQKLALRMMPIAGALFGASLNTAFLNHYRAVARARFTVRRLEREHGLIVQDAVRSIYTKIKQEEAL